MSSNDTRDEDLYERVFRECVDRLNAGKEIPRDRILGEHPDIAHELLEQLDAYEAFGFDAEDRSLDDAPLGTLGDYTLRRQIGRGGMGVVYEAWQGSMDRVVALKVLPPGVAADNKALYRFTREAKTAGQLNHQNIVAVHSTGVEEGTPWYSMEYVEGETLSQILSKLKEADSETETPFGPKDQVDYFAKIARAFADVADGLQHAHSKGVIHRDIKPSNLILDADGKLRILDFGLARLEGQESLTLSGDLMGTVLYMSPEQAMAKRIPLDQRTDVYSLGATIYEALTSQPPFRGKDQHDTLSRIIAHDPRPPRQLNPRIPRDLDTVVLKCLRKHPAQRYGTAEALAQDLRRFVRGDPIEARSQSSWERLGMRVWRHRRRVAVTGVLLVLVAALAFLFLKQQRYARWRRLEEYRSGVPEAVRMLQLGRLTTRLSAETAGPRKVDPLAFFASDSMTQITHAQGLSPVRESVLKLEQLASSLPDRPEAYFYAARGHLLLGRHEDALNNLEKALACRPDFLPAVTLRAAVFEDQGEEDRARRELRRSEETASEAWSIAFLGAHLAMRERRWRDAAESYEALIRMDRQLDSEGAELFVDSSAEFCLRCGAAHLLAGDYDRSIQYLAVARYLWPGAIEPVLGLGEAYYSSGRPHETDKLFEEFHGRTTYQDEAAFGMAVLYSYLEDYKRGLKWARAIGRSPLRERAELVHLVFDGQTRNAIETGREILAIASATDPSRSMVHGLLSLACYRQGDMTGALNAARRSVALDAGNVWGHHMLARALCNLGAIDPAIESAQTSIQLARGSATAHLVLTLAQAYFLKGRLNDAREQFQRGLSLLPELGSRRRSFAAWFHGQYARFFERVGHVGAAVEQYGLAIELDSREPPYHRHYHEQLCALLGREDPSSFQEELAHLIESLERPSRSPAGSPRVPRSLAQALACRADENDLAEALKLARRAVEDSERKEPEALTALAEVQAAAGELSAAVTSLETACRLPTADPSLEVKLVTYRQRLQDLATLPATSDRTILIGPATRWSLLRGVRQPSDGLEWTTAEFRDEGWSRAVGGFGYGLDYDYKTPLVDMPGSYTSLYIRHVFHLSEPRVYKDLSILVWADDGFVAYLNGAEVGRRNAGAGETTVPHDGSASDGARGERPTLLRVGAERLRKGDNCLAIHGLNHRETQWGFYLKAMALLEKLR